MKKISMMLCLAIGLLTAACQGGKIEKLEQQRDSLLQANADQEAILVGLSETMGEVSMNLDSLTRQERILISGVDETGNPMTKEGMKARLDAIQNLLKDQREKMKELEKKLGSQSAEVKRLQGVITFLNQQLEEKTAQIEQLQQELESKNYDISQLETRVAGLSDTVKTVLDENAQQREQLSKQDAAMNEVYYIIGTKKRLTDLGIISKSGLFSKAKVSFSSIDKSILTKADIRTLRTITINGKSPKLLSEVPNGSWTFDGTTLTITDPTAFWSANNRILVIQVK